jgi:hypothetical protein
MTKVLVLFEFNFHLVVIGGIPICQTNQSIKLTKWTSTGWSQPYMPPTMKTSAIMAELSLKTAVKLVMIIYGKWLRSHRGF